MAYQDTTRQKIAVVDVETTGLNARGNDRIVEIAIVVMSPSGHIHLEYESLVNPLRDVGPTRLHGITATDVLNAPTFDQIADDVLDVFAGSDVLAGHNLSFDLRFLVDEFDRVGVEFPQVTSFCTCNHLSRQNLASSCREYGIAFEGQPHHAITDARATARLIAALCSEDPSLLSQRYAEPINWPSFRPRQTPRCTRRHAQELQRMPPSFLQRLAARMHHDVEATPPQVLAYLALLDRTLEDRAIDAQEEDVLVNAALDWNLSSRQLEDAHRNYLHNLAVLALTNGVVSDAERRDLRLVAGLLGHDASTLDEMLIAAALQLAPLSTFRDSSAAPRELTGRSVCFTGELTSTIAGQPITRDVAEALAEGAGLTVLGGVTKKLDILVVADPDTQSGKARKARDYGTRIVADTVFWRMIGVTID